MKPFSDLVTPWTLLPYLHFFIILSAFFIQVLDQLDKKRKAVMDQKEKGEKILKDPKAPKFLSAHMDKLNALWADANKCAESRLKQLKGKQNLTSSVISTQKVLTLQTKMNAKLNQQRFGPCHEDGLIKMIQMIPQNPYVNFKSTSFLLWLYTAYAGLTYVFQVKQETQNLHRLWDIIGIVLMALLSW